MKSSAEEKSEKSENSTEVESKKERRPYNEGDLVYYNNAYYSCSLSGTYYIEEGVVHFEGAEEKEEESCGTCKKFCGYDHCVTRRKKDE